MKSVFLMYIVWMLIFAVYSGWVVYTSNFRDNAGSEMFREFVANYIGIAVVLFFLGGLLAWLTDKGKLWAKWLFIGYCTYRAIDSIWGVYLLEGMNPSLIDTSDWVKGAIFAVIWLFLVGLAWRARPNKSFSPDALTRAG